MTTQNKVYRINGKEIKQAGAWEDDKNFGHNDVNDVVNQLLEALSDKEEECKHLDMGKHPFTGVPMCTKCGWWNKEEPNQEECKDCKLYAYENGLEYTPATCMVHNKPKQSTNLKEEAKEIILMDKTYPTASQRADKILKLLQSHLVKEVEKQEMPGYQDEGAEHAHAGYVRALEDIIKIINNIIK